MSFIHRSTLTININLNCERKINPLQLWWETLNSVVYEYNFDKIMFLTVKSSRFIIISTFIIRWKVLQCVKMPPPPSALVERNVKLLISHQYWIRWRCADTSTNFYFLGNRHPRINDIGICSPVVVYCPQLQICFPPQKEAS